MTEEPRRDDLAEQGGVADSLATGDSPEVDSTRVMPPVEDAQAVLGNKRSATVLGAAQQVPQQPTPPKRKRGLVIGLGVGLLVLALVTIFVIIPAIRDSRKTAELAVTQYLMALSTSDANTALSFARAMPADTRFLTNEQLQKSNALAPISEILVDKTGTNQPTAVTAHYKIGAEPVDVTLDVNKTATGWKIDKVANELDFTAAQSTGLSLLLNDQKIESSVVAVFPGSYKVITQNKFLSLGEQTLVVKDTTSAIATAFTPVITEEGKAAILTAAKAKWAACLAEKALVPNDCGFGAAAPEGVTIATDSIKWTQTAAAVPVERATVAVDSEDATVAIGTFDAKIRCTAKSSDDKSYFIDISPKTFTVDLNAEPLTVTFA